MSLVQPPEMPAQEPLSPIPPPPPVRIEEMIERVERDLFGPPVDLKGVPARPAPPPPPAEVQAKAALEWLRRLPREDAYQVVFLDWRMVPHENLDEWKTVCVWWLNMMSTSQSVLAPQDVPGTLGRLQWLDLRWYRWVRAGWQTVSERDPYSQEPWVHPDTAKALREVGGWHLSEETAKRDRYPVVAMMSGPFLFRETVESDRSPSYYDLLFGRERFGPEGGGPAAAAPAAGAQATEDLVHVERGGFLREVRRSEVSPGEAVYVRRGTALVREQGPAAEPKTVQPRRIVKKDFPADVKDWEEFWGLDLVKEFGRKRELDFDFGAVTEGAYDNPRRGSIVALHNRLVLDEPSALSRAMRTFDTKESSGERNYFDISDRIPFLVKDRKLKFDGGELLAYLPNGGQAALLINAEGKRVEVADGRLAYHSRARRPVPGVRNPGDCVMCHGDQGGYILPRNIVEEAEKRGVATKFKDPKELERYKGFFFEWQERVAPVQAGYNSLISRATRKSPKEKGWEPARLVKAFVDRWEYYDDPVTIERAAYETGYTLEIFQRTIARLDARQLDPANKGKRLLPGQLGRLMQGIEIPRRVWEQDVYPVIARAITE